MGALTTTNAKLESIMNEMREYHASMSLKLTSIETRLDAIPIFKDYEGDEESEWVHTQ
ncbi:hypothetical protein ACLOJK_006455 [Asimina triloba]